MGLMVGLGLLGTVAKRLLLFFTEGARPRTNSPCGPRLWRFQQVWLPNLGKRLFLPTSPTSDSSVNSDGFEGSISVIPPSPVEKLQGDTDNIVEVPLHNLDEPRATTELPVKTPVKANATTEVSVQKLGEPHAEAEAPAKVSAETRASTEVPSPAHGYNSKPAESPAPRPSRRRKRPAPPPPELPTFNNANQDEFIVDKIRQIVRERNLPIIPDILDGRNLSFVVHRDGHPWKLGEGAFGKVFLGNLTHDDQTHLVAIKCIKSSIRQSELQDVVREASVGAYCQEAGQDVVPRYFGLVGIEGRYQGDEFSDMAIVSEFVGEAKSYKVWPMHRMMARERMRLSMGLEPMISRSGWIKILHSLAKKVASLHSIQVYIQDVKEDNVILRRGPDGRFDPVLVDVGVAVLHQRSPELEARHSLSELEDLMARHSQTPPEYLLYGQVSGANDVYSLGLLLLKVRDLLGLRNEALDTLTARCREFDFTYRPDIRHLIHGLKTVRYQLAKHKLISI